MEWAQGIFTFQPGAAEHIAHVPLIYKLHIVLGLTIFLVFPFTRLVHILSGFAAPVRYLFARKGYQIVRTRRQAPLSARGSNPPASAKQPAE